MKKINFLAILPVVLGFLLIAVYFYPAFTGKTLSQNDVIQSMGAIKEARDFKAATGEDILWSNSMFSGMPVWDGFGSNVILKVHRAATAAIPVPALITFCAFISFYILLLAYNSNRWLAFAGGLAFAFSTFNIISIEAGHINKVFAIAFMPGVIAGIVYVFRGKWITGAIVTILATSLHIFYFHVQITYYLLIIIAFLSIAELITHFKENKLPDFFKGAAILVVAALIAILPNIGRMMTMQEYAKYTPRGGSELSKKAKDKGGLDYDYAFQWSNGLAEPITIFIPGFYGGSSTENIGKGSEFYKSIKQTEQGDKAGEYAKQAPLYWGDQPFTSGPVYFGAIICFFFLLGMVLLKGPWKWALFGASILSIILSYGKNLPEINDFFFYHVPMYNKFRSVTMILSIAQLAFPLVGFVALKKILDGEFTKEEINFALKVSTIALGSIAAIYIVFAGMVDVSAPGDGQYPDFIQKAIASDRTGRLRFDAFRSLVLVLIGGGLVWAWVNEKLKAEALCIILALVIVVDLWTVDRKYLNKDNFKPGKNLVTTAFVPSYADETIARDTTKSFRVFNVSVNPFNDATTSYYHKSVGGYSAIKLGRYQDVIDSCLYKNNMQVLNMLNTRYFITQDQQSGTLVAQLNRDALGNAWFVSTVTIVKNADEELVGLKTFNPKQTVLVDKRFENQLKGFQPQLDSNASIKLAVYHPNRLTYTSTAATEQVAVFSEIYFTPGWQAYIDGKPVEHFRCNYVLRGMKVPAGTHKIEFKFEPAYYYSGEKIALTGSIIMLSALVGLIGFGVYKCRKKE